MLNFVDKIVSEIKMYFPDKFIAKKPISEIKTHLQYGFVVMEVEVHYCPRCRHILNADPQYQPKYCDQYGQRVTFVGVEWNKSKKLDYLSKE